MSDQTSVWEGISGSTVAYRLKLLGLPMIPVTIFVVVSARYFVSYIATFTGYAGIFNKAELRHLIGNFVYSLGEERQAIARSYAGILDSGTCLINDTRELQQAFQSTDISIAALLRWAEKKENKRYSDFFESSAFRKVENEVMKIRSKLSNDSASNCSIFFFEISTFYSTTIKQSIENLPNFHEAELSKITLLHIHALQDILEAYEDFSLLCYLGSRPHPRESELPFVVLLSSGSVALERAFQGDDSLMNLYEDLVREEFSHVNYFIDQANRFDIYEDIQSDILLFGERCEQVGLLLKRLGLEVYQGEKREGFEREWRQCVAGMVIYLMALFMLLPNMVAIWRNCEMTINNLMQFTRSLQNQVEKLVEEKRRTDDLLTEMFPRSVVVQLKDAHNVNAELFESTTVCFSDVVDFSEIIFSNDPIQIVTFLNSIYTIIDTRIMLYDVYKVETIGSVYMVVSGVPVRNGQQHVVEVADMSLDILATIDKQKFPDIQRKVELRIGIHTGPCVAGVVGNKMTRYCLFGDTVNTASRMQSTGAASRIQISSTTRSMLFGHENYVMQKRGELKVKGKGIMETFWLVKKISKVDI